MVSFPEMKGSCNMLKILISDYGSHLIHAFD